MTTAPITAPSRFLDLPRHAAFAALEPLPAEAGPDGATIVRFRAPYDGLRVVMTPSGFCELQRLAYNPSMVRDDGAPEMLLVMRSEAILRYWPEHPVDAAAAPDAVARAIADDLARVQSKCEHLQVQAGTPQEFLALLDAIAVLASGAGRTVSVETRCETSPGKKPVYGRLRRGSDDLPAGECGGLRAALEAVLFEFAPCGWTQEISGNGLIKRDGMQIVRAPATASAHQRMAAANLLIAYARDARQRLSAVPRGRKRAAEIAAALAASGLLDDPPRL